MRSARARTYGTLASALAAFVALSAVGIAAAEKPIVVEAGKLKLTFNGGFTPKALPKKTMAPIVLDVSGKIQSTDPAEPQPAALQKFILDIDENIAVDFSGYPTCSWGSRGIRRDLKAIEKTCGTSVVGGGRTNFSFNLPGQKVNPDTGKSLLLNGGTSGNKTTLYIYTYRTQPITTAIVIPVKITKIKNGRFGTKAVATVPPIANGAGAMISFDLQINKGLKVKGKPFSALFAKCPDGHLNIRGSATFKDGTETTTEVVRPCTGKR
jgi:hypothetical protein